MQVIKEESKRGVWCGPMGLSPQYPVLLLSRGVQGWRVSKRFLTRGLPSSSVFKSWHIRHGWWV